MKKIGWDDTKNTYGKVQHLFAAGIFLINVLLQKRHLLFSRLGENLYTCLMFWLSCRTMIYTFCKMPAPEYFIVLLVLQHMFDDVREVYLNFNWSYYCEINKKNLLSFSIHQPYIAKIRVRFTVSLNYELYSDKSQRFASDLKFLSLA